MSFSLPSTSVACFTGPWVMGAAGTEGFSRTVATHVTLWDARLTLKQPADKATWPAPMKQCSKESNCSFEHDSFSIIFGLVHLWLRFYRCCRSQSLLRRDKMLLKLCSNANQILQVMNPSDLDTSSSLKMKFNIEYTIRSSMESHDVAWQTWQEHRAVNSKQPGQSRPYFTFSSIFSLLLLGLLRSDCRSWSYNAISTLQSVHIQLMEYWTQCGPHVCVVGFVNSPCPNAYLLPLPWVPASDSHAWESLQVWEVLGLR